MPALAINDSWRYYPEVWKRRVFVDFPMQGGREHELPNGDVIKEPAPELAITCLSESAKVKPPLKRSVWPETEWLVFTHVNRVRGEPVRFSGFELDQGTHGFAGGTFAIEVATWFGYDPIFLLGFDFRPGPRCFGGQRNVMPETANEWLEIYKHYKTKLAASGRTLRRIGYEI